MASKGKMFRSEMMKLATVKYKSGESLYQECDRNRQFHTSNLFERLNRLVLFLLLNLSQKARGISPSNNEI